MSKSNVYHTVSPPNHASQCAMLISRQFLGMKFFFPDKDLRSDGEVLSAAPGFGCYAQKKPGNHPHLHWPRPLRSLVGNVRLSETLAGSRLSQNAIEMVQDMSMLTIACLLDSHDFLPTSHHQQSFGVWCFLRYQNAWRVGLIWWASCSACHFYCS